MYDFFEDKNKKRSSITGVLNNLFNFSFGNNSKIDRGSIIAPDKICAPSSLPFSSTQILISLFFLIANCLSLIAAESPDGPPQL